ncbi:MAG TPA: phospho-N-acetylmuramoyl-pentapeptide-transferase [Clostridiaceae bacterium]|nr:phospho-N-acetylmuramoyl-pentapeptide-transferase [Clostridiaceae bacterium]
MDILLNNTQLAQRLIGGGCGVAVLTIIFGFILLPFLTRRKVSQSERLDGPQSHLKKTGTPTFGGLFFVPSIMICSVIDALIWHRSGTLMPLLYVLCIALVGFMDDYTKVLVNKEGLSPKQKSFPILVLAAIFICWYLFIGPFEPHIFVPFGGGLVPVSGLGKLFYGLFLLIYLYAVSNSVNLTDGVDGLLSTVTLPVGVTLTITAVVMGRELQPIFQETAVLSVFILGACLGFLVFNRHPAKVFMGDTGSLALGALIAVVAMLQGIPWVLLLAGIIYVAEAGSVLIQTIYFRRTGGQRIFRMSPIHHHFELGGWSENKVVGVFTAVSTAGCLLGLLTVLPFL